MHRIPQGTQQIVRRRINFLTSYQVYFERKLADWSRLAKKISSLLAQDLENYLGNGKGNLIIVPDFK